MRQPLLSKALAQMVEDGCCYEDLPAAVILCKHGVLWFVYPGRLIEGAMSKEEHGAYIVTAPINACSEGPDCPRGPIWV